MDKLLIIVPAFNEEESIIRVIEEVKNVGLSNDLVVINDCSTDKTEELIRNLEINIVSHPVNLGAGAAIQTGLKYAQINNYDLMVVVDGDGQHDPKEIPKMVVALKENLADVAVGSRFLTNGQSGKQKIHWARQIGIKIFSVLLSLIVRSKITDTTSGFRAFNKRAIKFLAHEMPADFPDADMLLSLIFAGFKIIEVPVNMRERIGGRSMYSGLRSVYYPFKLTIAILAVLLKSFLERRK
ncbi:hypothetical protein A2276_05825 [candidate division WOR-1 bacterium RIFOXYA12_FULL_43_27]|uniref:Glycosyltransferase 2-like domain-containing protein n=1 Tax=candidate division WOR-1 bacterium RIFOXYC2_FULL_46_14 TaxID=1802587 RepID=A0A1F4U3E2_UNCSA|nr:MAG: hypothetical protein A2276_05825 [candidate division WOR-1 bacterium RIFOXYA12_FULL_43_27]OGC20180.1 MAG: hypothetical protein A2292_03825 [candidate division WOR-1 bacterium RIFOXYB2_FULL_46_45]OGC32082.1 MAG: hypothetical protein A2232_07620 [candidate division WOR-1 bacterium RIFOXYA2_FULL_46_56]OGC39484.1 MAG: hypothetical protein A2438_07985 [candidate division WOR-1 bacterium RIFOXYC2_FULL_46_14]